MDIRLIYFIGGLVVVLLLLLISFVLNERRASRIENTLDELQDQLRRDEAAGIVHHASSTGGSLDSSQINVTNAHGEEQPLDEVLSDLSSKIDAASAEQQKSYANIMADQQSLKHSISQLKTLISSLPTHAIAQAAAASSGGDRDESAASNTSAQPQLSENTLIETTNTAAPVRARINTDVRLPVDDLVLPDMGRSSGNRGPSLGSGMSANYARAQQVRQQRGSSTDFVDPDLQADLAFAAANRHHAAGSGVYMPDAGDGSFVQTANNIAQMVAATDFSQLSQNQAPATIGEQMSQAQAAAASASNAATYGYGQNPAMGNQLHFADQSMAQSQGRAQGQPRRVIGGVAAKHSSGRDPRNPLGMGNYGVSSPKDNGANAEDAELPSVSANADNAANTVSEEIVAPEPALDAVNESAEQSSAPAADLSSDPVVDLTDNDETEEVEIEPQSISQHSLEKAQAFAEAYAERKQLASKQDEPAVLSADADESGDASPDAVADADVSASASASAVSTEPEANEGVSGDVSSAESQDSVAASSPVSFATVLAGSTVLQPRENDLDAEMQLHVEPVAAVPATPEIESDASVEEESSGLNLAHLNGADDDERFDALQSLAANYQQQLSQSGSDEFSPADDADAITESSEAAGAATATSPTATTSGANLTIDFAPDDAGQFKVTVANVDTDSSDEEEQGELPRHVTDLEDEGLSFDIEMASPSGNVSSADAVAAATAAQIAERPVAATVAQASGVGAKVPVVDMIFDEEYVRKQQREKPNGIDLKILDKAHSFIDAGVSLMELSARTGLSEEELRLLYDVDENGRIKDAAAIFEQMHREGDDLALDEIASREHEDDDLSSDVDVAAAEEETVASSVEAESEQDDAALSVAAEEQPEHEEQELAAALAAGESKNRRKSKNSKKRKRRSLAIRNTNPAAALDQDEQQEIASMMEHKEDPFAHSTAASAEDEDMTFVDVELHDGAHDRSEEESADRAERVELAEGLERPDSLSAADQESADDLSPEEHEAEHLAEVTAAARERQEQQAIAAKNSQLDRNLEAIDRLADSIIEKNRQKSGKQKQRSLEQDAVPATANTEAVGAGASDATAEPEFLEAEPINNRYGEHGPRVRAGVQSYNQISHPVGLGSVDEDEPDFAGADASSAATAAAAGYQRISTSADAAKASSEIVKAMSDNLEINAPYVQQLRAGIADAIDHEDDNVTIAGVAATGGTVRSTHNNTPAMMSAGTASVATGWTQQQRQAQVRKPHSASAVQAAINTPSIDAVGRINTREVSAVGSDEDLVFSQAHANAQANAREITAAAQAGDPHALMAGRKRQSTGNGLFSMLSTPLNAAQNLAAQATSALRGGAKGKGTASSSSDSVATTNSSGESQGRKGNRGADRVTLSAAATKAATKATTETTAAQPSAASAASANAESSPVRYKRESGVIDVPVPLETMAAGKMTVDMALAQMEQEKSTAESDDALAGANAALRQAQAALVAEAGGSAEAELGSASDRLLGRADANVMVGETLDAAAFGSMREEQAYNDLMDEDAYSEEPEQESTGTLSPEQLETLKSLQTGAAAAMSAPPLSSNFQPLPSPMPRRRRDPALDVLGTEPPRHFANLQARNAYGMRN